MGDHRAWCHIPNAELAVRALDGGRALWSTSAACHLGRCGACRDRLAVYERVVAAGRLTHPGQVLQEPPPRVWAAVRTDLVADRRRTTPTGGPPVPTARRVGNHALRYSVGVVRAVSRHLLRLRPGGPRGPHT